jgi:hypothetical protein
VSIDQGWNATSSHHCKEKVRCSVRNLTMLHKVSMPNPLRWKEFDKGQWSRRLVVKNNNDAINFELTNFDYEWNIFNPMAHIKEIWIYNIFKIYNVHFGSFWFQNGVFNFCLQETLANGNEIEKKTYPPIKFLSFSYGRGFFLKHINYNAIIIQQL